MAARKKTAAKKVAAKKPGTAVANIDQQLAEEAAALSDRLGASESRNISIRDKVFTFPDGSIVEAPLRLVIVDFISANMYYDRPFDAKAPMPPACFALGIESNEKLLPSDASPAKQNGDCETCPQNEWGSGSGDSKACKNQRHLAVMRPDDDPEEGEIFRLSVPPASLKKFDGYVKTVRRLFQAPPVKVITSVYFHPEATYPSLLFGNPEPNELYAAHFARREQAREFLLEEPDVSGYVPEQPKKARRTRSR